MHQLTVVGVGGCGGNTVRCIRERGLDGVDLIAANTDLQALSKVGGGVHHIQIGPQKTGGLGAGLDWERGQQSALESRDEIAAALDGADMVFVTAGMGGGTGTGGAPVVAEIAQESGALALAVVTTPFAHEEGRIEVARAGIERLRDHVDGLMVISNAKLGQMHGQMGIRALFNVGTSVLYDAVRSITDLILYPGLVNVDFNDVRTAFRLRGATALMGTGTAEGNDRAERAANEAVNCPLLEEVPTGEAHGLLINIIGDCSGAEYEAIHGIAATMAAKDAIIKCGQVPDAGLEDGVLKVTVIATGISSAAEAMPGPEHDPWTPDLYEKIAPAD